MCTLKRYYHHRSHRWLWMLLGVMVGTFGCGGGGGGFHFKDTPPGSADAQREPPDEQARQTLLATIETEDFVACRDQGFYFDRRQSECVEDLKINKFPCTRQGILDALNGTGAQITLILDRSLGDPSKPDDKGEGFVIDQCGRSATGRVLVNLVRLDQDGKMQVRELEMRR